MKTLTKKVLEKMSNQVVRTAQHSATQLSAFGWYEPKVPTQIKKATKSK